MTLTTMIVSNLLLYGIADTLAQSLTSLSVFKPETGPDAGFRIPFILEKFELRRIRLPDNNGDDANSFNHSQTSVINNSNITLATDSPYLDDTSNSDADGDTDTDSINSQELAELGLTEDLNTFRLLGQSSNPTSRHTETVSSSMRSSRKIQGLLFKSFDFRRLSLFMVWGFVQALLQYCWYPILNSLYNEDNLFLSTLKRVLTDQLCYSPLSLMAFFVYTTIVMEHGDKEAVKLKLKTAFLQTLVVNYAVWPAAQFINFLFIPRSLQVPFASTVGVFWNAYLSLANASSS